MFSITKELNCYITCITGSDSLKLIGIQLLLALGFFSLYLKSRTPTLRLFSFVAAQLSMVFVIGTIVSAMQCSEMLTIQIYTIYVVVSTVLIMFLPRIYYRILIKKYRAQPISDIINWPQQYVNSLTEGAKVYYYDSAVPKAFASGKSIFLSLGILELMSDLELKAILAHEVWHLRHNNKTPILRQLSIVTFTKNRSENELELLADIFAGETVNEDAVKSAREKLN